MNVRTTLQRPPLAASAPSASRQALRTKIVSYLILGVFAIVYIGPLLMLVNTALKSLAEFYRDPIALPSSLMLDNFFEAWELANFPGYLMNSVFYVVAATGIFVLTSLFVAFPIARGYFKGSNVLLTLYLIALFLPAALIPQFQLILHLGLYNTQPGYILLFLVNPIGMIILVNYMKSIPR
jgi:raffinose/stachyose/melibiose transport system permease protein